MLAGQLEPYHLDSRSHGDLSTSLLADEATDTTLQQLCSLKTPPYALSKLGKCSVCPHSFTVFCKDFPFDPYGPSGRGPPINARRPHSALLQANRHLAGCKFAGRCKELEWWKAIGQSLQTSNSRPSYNGGLQSRSNKLRTSTIKESVLCRVLSGDLHKSLDPSQGGAILIHCRGSHAQQWPKHFKADEKLVQHHIAALVEHLDGPDSKTTGRQRQAQT
jgi:hypothetical protein